MNRPWWRDRLGAAQLHLLARAVLLALLAFLLARLLWVLVTPVGPLGDWRPAPPRIAAPATRTAILSTVDPFSGQPASVDTNQVTSLDLELFGVTVNQGAGTGSAIIGFPDGTQQSIAVGEEILPGASLAEVGFNYIVIDRGGIRERLYLDESQPADIAQPEMTPTAGPVGTEGRDPSRAFAIAPRMRGGKITGVRLTPGPDRALFDETGLSPGDIVVEVNGTSIADTTDIEMLRRELKPGARINLTVERGAERLPIAISF
ncbi:type II secretion system protein N [Sphingomicrobium lutaoense]|uniref:General secretion pathway protein C n=1 Tax=Sphingomicrobium lutaoense TaxID=515949 RepID=A0A839Z7Q2_9SPHN|nr:type II secretion system protein N [Sphingomicrobium lutaoense]MBB3764904.1 general secretion pathway protein C [Sphingomicrobium lutaoense]